MDRLLVVVFLVAGCSSGPGASTVGVPADFATKALVVCQHAHDLKLAEGPFPLPAFNPTKPDASLFPEVGAFLKLTDATFGTWSSEMKALGSPSTGQSAWLDLIAAIDRHVSLNADQIAAAKVGDTATFAKDYAAGLVTQADLLKAATAAGVPDCAKVDR